MGLIIIGAGIAGLTAGIYARLKGIDTQIIEMHSIPGGNCTSWKRGGYTFEGGMHWLTGSSAKTPLHKIWLDTGAINAGTKFFARDPFITAGSGSDAVSLYRDIERLKEHLLGVSPEDASLIGRLCTDIKHFTFISAPVDGFPPRAIWEVVKSLPSFAWLSTHSVPEYTARFKNPAIRLALNNVVGPGFSALSLLFTLGCFASGDGLYPEGGSIEMVRRMAERFTSLGGKIRYNCRADQVLLDTAAGSTQAWGIRSGDELIQADAVLVTSDMRQAIDSLFAQPLGKETGDAWADKLRSRLRPVVSTFISLGLKTGLAHLPDKVAFYLKEPFEYAGKKIESLFFNNYASYPGYAPGIPGAASSITISISGDTWAYWNKCQTNGSYAEKKQELADKVIKALYAAFPEMAGTAEVQDVATPQSYERYCGTWHGSWMTIWEAGKGQARYPLKSPSIENLFFAGQRLRTPGGLPIAAATGYQVAELFK
ncbi:MAG: NAD(P)/FAD-dependent oxidoreductase [Spirochaetaceae bacterium]|jgi:phytoene dehydrogenase-like protein|nr:NAD(P)/FAD-dependent oxidoreductase [Spirochaetaceae bacterium]